MTLFGHMNSKQIHTLGNPQVFWILKIKWFIFSRLQVTSLKFCEHWFHYFLFSCSGCLLLKFTRWVLHKTLTISAAAVAYGLAAPLMFPSLSLTPATHYCKPNVVWQQPTGIGCSVQQRKQGDKKKTEKIYHCVYIIRMFSYQKIKKNQITKPTT